MMVDNDSGEKLINQIKKPPRIEINNIENNNSIFMEDQDVDSPSFIRRGSESSVSIKENSTPIFRGRLGPVKQINIRASNFSEFNKSVCQDKAQVEHGTGTGAGVSNFRRSDNFPNFSMEKYKYKLDKFIIGGGK